ncbi:hypothetical protein BgAZ_205070 [Babesia gibsoni]|uniref:Uncharacterized protein n=1 Tax=Babesia gibsoni TaxID=33632 RepID=A0AAD8LQS3_BABGI|nr:hypothetical protein BgAZ_205070 [Babesia gibsoni]
MTLLHDARMARKSGTFDFGATSHTTNTGTASEQLDNIYFRERDAPKDGNNELIESAIYELNQLDDSLDELFKDAYVDFETHQQIHKFRLRVSRRISAFGSILRKLLKYTENTTAANKLKLQSLHRLYLDHLMRDDTENLIEEDDVRSDAEGESVIVMKLKATRNMMLNQINQMSATELSMLKSSNYIVNQNKTLAGNFTRKNKQTVSVLKKRFGSASQLFKSVRRRFVNRI